VLTIGRRLTKFFARALRQDLKSRIVTHIPGTCEKTGTEKWLCMLEKTKADTATALTDGVFMNRKRLWNADAKR